jgi:hypothetical protein
VSAPTEPTEHKGGKGRKNSPAPAGWVAQLRDMPVHPLLARYPRLTGAELQALVDDIRAHGLHQALAVTPDGQLLDGRARLEACIQTGVAPFVTIWGGDPEAYIRGANLLRRHLRQPSERSA